MNADSFGFGEDECANAETLIGMALVEDLGADARVDADLTGRSIIPPAAQGSAMIRSRSEGVIAGIPVVEMLCDRLQIKNRVLIRDGQTALPGQPVMFLWGSMRALLALERTALNFLQRLSGVATLTSRFVSEIVGTQAAIFDTRKTTPGWRFLEKYAVRCGGGRNHRVGLYDAVLIKDNHLAWLAREADPIGRAIADARRNAPNAKFLEVEVDSLDQLDRALQCAPDIVLLDNLGPESLVEAVRRRDRISPKILLEASGGVTLLTVRRLAIAGVNRISVGALTHSAPALDLGLDYEETR